MKKLLLIAAALLSIGVSAYADLPTDDELLTTPKGEPKAYLMSRDYGYGSQSGSDSNLYVKIWFDNDGTVYFPTEIFDGAGGAYVIGKQEGNKITIDADQYVCCLKISWADEHHPSIAVDPWAIIYWYQLKFGKVSNEGEIVESYPTLTFDIDENSGMITQADEYSACSQEISEGYLYTTSAMEFSPTEMKEVTPPEGAEVLRVAYHYDMPMYDIKDRLSTAFMVRDGNDIYLQGLVRGSMGWLKGTIDGNKLIIPSGQFAATLGTVLLVEPKAVEYLGFDPLTYEVQFTEMEALVLVSDDGFESMKVDNPSNGIWEIASGIEHDIFTNLRIEKYEEHLGTPMAPGNVSEWYGRDDEWAFKNLSFEIYPYDTEGKLLNIDNLYYRIYMDDEQYTFTSESYRFIKEEMDEIPFGYSDNGPGYVGFDFFVHSETARELYINELEDFSKLEISTVYRNDEGERESTKVPVWTSTGINDTIATSEVVDTEYYSITGLRVSETAKGVIIKVERLADGTRRQMKIYR